MTFNVKCFYTFIKVISYKIQFDHNICRTGGTRLTHARNLMGLGFVETV